METTLIGSLPYKEPEVAVEKSFSSVTIPCWPQLPKRSFKEQMCPQYSENFPGVVIDEISQKIFVDENKLYQEIDKFYQNYIDGDINYFAISEMYAAGFYKFLDFVKKNKYVTKLKLQTVGVLTFGLTIKTENGQPLFYNEQYRELIIKHLTMKSLWQIKFITDMVDKNVDVILFYDEPYLAAYGSAFTAVNKDEIIKCLSEIISETKNMAKDKFDKINLKIGIHCCANTDWSILASVDKLDIISFDTYDYFETFSLYKEEIKRFILRGGKIAWGVIPNNDRIFEVGTSISDFIKNKEELVKKIEDIGNYLLNNTSSEKLTIESILKSGMVTPQCGLGNTSIEIAEKVLEICKMFSGV